MTKLCVYSSHAYEMPYLEKANDRRYPLIYVKETLSKQTTSLATGSAGVVLFTSDDANGEVIKDLHDKGIQFVITRSAGYDHIDLEMAKRLGMRVANAPAYSPNSVAEHAVAMMLSLSRRLTLSNDNVHRYNFSVDDLVGFNLHEKTVGIIGTGKIGAAAIEILHGFGCKILAHDISPDKLLAQKFDVIYSSLEEVCIHSDIISLHTPLTTNTTYLINKTTIDMMKQGVMIINTSRGKVINTTDALEALSSGKIGYLGLDVYENEKGIFFNDLSAAPPADPLLKQLLSLPNVLITPHQAFLTKEALEDIAKATIQNIDCFMNGIENPNELTAIPKVKLKSPQTIIQA
jgi:D-lactate dehydrogenase